MSKRARRLFPLAAIFAAVSLMSACGPQAPQRTELRLVTDDFVIRVSPENTPTRALDPIYWRVVVHERSTGKPVEGGQGRIFGTNSDRKTTSNGLEETDELGTYRSNLMFVTAGMWAMAVQFRRDSTEPLQKTQDWTQDILKAEEPGKIEPPSIGPEDTLPAGKSDTTR